MMTCNFTGQPEIIKGKYVYEGKLPEFSNNYVLVQSYFRFSILDLLHELNMYSMSVPVYRMGLVDCPVHSEVNVLPSPDHSSYT